MKRPEAGRMINPRNPWAHLIIFLFSLVVVLIDMGNNHDLKSINNYLGGFMVTFTQLELFILLAYTFFSNVTPGKTPREITRIVLLRFAFFFIACFITALLVMLVYLHIRQLLAGGSLKHVTVGFFHAGFIPWLKPTLVGLSSGAVIFVIVLWQDTLQREQKLREENLIFQNETLKNQVNPHFLFNSFNTLSALMVTQPELADKFIHKLSSIYRYILENIGKDKIPLSSELSFISDYFELHKIRDEGKMILTIDVPDTATFMILPVSLQILVENAIKHNKATREDPLKISIFVEEDQIVVKNNLQKMASQVRSTGIGLKNLANRTALICGRALVIEETAACFIVKVPLL